MVNGRRLESSLGEVGSLAWFYVDGTKDGVEGVSSGSIIFDAGMADDGEYKALLFEDDGYTVLAETFFNVQQPAPDSLKLVSISPADGEKNADPAIVFSAIIRNGGTSLNTDSVKLSLDSKDVKVEITTDEDGFNTVSFTSDRLFEPGSSHKFQLEFSDDSDPVKSEIVTVDFDVASYLKIDMPDPIHYQDFNQIEEFELPKDWEVVNLSQEINSELGILNGLHLLMTLFLLISKSMVMQLTAEQVHKVICGILMKPQLVESMLVN